MKIAVVHDWLVDWAGSERVVEQILACYPTADLFALVDFLPPELRTRVLGKQARTTFLQHWPFARSHLAIYLPWMPIAIEQLELSSYDLVISSSHAVAKGVITGPDQLHVSYVHSPMRYAWDLQADYLRGTSWWSPKGFATRWLLHYLRLWDARTPNGVDAFIANSQFIARRIRKVYARSAEVIYPPVDLHGLDVSSRKEDFYLSLGRLMPYKRTDLIIEAFRQLPNRTLVVAGDGPERRRLQKNAPKNVEFVGNQTEIAKAEYLKRARALIFAAKEDFGITPVEAQACGTPVLAYGAGGALETIEPLGSQQPTGVFFASQTADAIAAAVREFEENAARFDPAACRANAERFGPERFRRELVELIEELASARR